MFTCSVPGRSYGRGAERGPSIALLVLVAVVRVGVVGVDGVRIVVRTGAAALGCRKHGDLVLLAPLVPEPAVRARRRAPARSRLPERSSRRAGSGSRPSVEPARQRCPWPRRERSRHRPLPAQTAPRRAGARRVQAGRRRLSSIHRRPAATHPCQSAGWRRTAARPVVTAWPESSALSPACARGRRATGVTPLWREWRFLIAAAAGNS